MAVSRGTLLVLLSAFFSVCLASECLNKCESCSKRIQCHENLKAYVDACHTEINEACVQVGNEANCLDLKTSCHCSDRTGCYDDPYSSLYYIDCSGDITLYSECPEGQVHDGKCGCIEGVSKTNLEDFFVHSEKAVCDWCIVNATLDCGVYALCSDPSLLQSQCAPGECFDEDICACVTAPVTTEPPPQVVCNGTTTLPCAGMVEVEQPNGCSKFYLCSTSEYVTCPVDQCFDVDVCGCAPTDPCNNSSCGFLSAPESGCEAYVDCHFPDNIEFCYSGCFDESTCTCGGGTGTSMNPSTTDPCENCDFYSSSDPCSTALSCADSTAEPIVCSYGMCYNDVSCACEASLEAVNLSKKDTMSMPKSCDSCGMMKNPEGICRSFYNCFNESETYECPEGTCFDSGTCSCT